MLRLISSRTIEEIVLERAQKKLELDGKVIQAGKFDEKTTSEEYEKLLVSYTECVSNSLNIADRCLGCAFRERWCR